jgi:hypothetical protein
MGTPHTPATTEKERSFSLPDNNNNNPFYAHREFEEALLKGLAKVGITGDNAPVTPDEFDRMLGDVISNAQPISVAIESEKKIAWLSLPATAAELDKALLTIDAQDKQYSIGDYRTPLNISLDNIVVGGDINEVNYLAARLAELPQIQLDKLAAIMETPGAFTTIAGMIDFTYNTDFYVLIPGVFNHIQLGEYYLDESEMIQMPEEWTGAINIEMLGELAAKHEDGVFTGHGYLLPSGDQWREVFEKTRVVPPEYRIGNYLKNAEVSTEQNYNQIDGVINNEGPRGADLTDGQTHEEIQELAPETPRHEGKPSILAELKKAQESIVKPDGNKEKKPPGLDL